MKKYKADLFLSVGFLVAFVAWTIGVLVLDVTCIGPMGSKVGMGGLNGFFHNLTGVHMELYLITDWLSLIPLGTVLLFGVVGLEQWIKRKRLLAVDGDILALGVFYLLVMAAFFFFEKVVINFRPVLIDGVLEPSYPSSTTLLVMTVMPAAVMQIRRRIKGPALRQILAATCAVYTGAMVVGRLISGVHWLTDIIGGILLSAGLCLGYRAFLRK